MVQEAPKRGIHFHTLWHQQSMVVWTYGKKSGTATSRFVYLYAKNPAVSLPSGHETWRKLPYFWMTFQFKSHLDVISNCHVWLPERKAAIIHYIYLYVIHCLSTSYPLVNPDCCDYTHYCWLVNVSYITIYQHIPLDSNHIPLVISHVSSTLKTPLSRYQ